MDTWTHRNLDTPALQLDPATQVAKVVGYVLNPFLFPPLLAALLLAHFGAPSGEIFRLTALFFLFFSLIPLTHILWLLRRRRISSVEIVQREERIEPLAVALAAQSVALVAIPFASETIPWILGLLIGCQIANTALLAAITMRWKISIHSATIGGFVTVLFFFALVAGPEHHSLPEPSLLQPHMVAAGIPLVPLLMWARVRVRVHSPAQAIVGAAAGVLLTAAELSVLYRLGLLVV